MARSVSVRGAGRLGRGWGNAPGAAAVRGRRAGCVGDGGGRGSWLFSVTALLLKPLLATRLPKLPAQTVPGGRVRLVWRPLLAPGAAFVAGMLGGAGFLAFVALHVRDLGMAGAGGALFTFGLVVVGCRLGFARTVDRVPAVHWLPAQRHHGENIGDTDTHVIFVELKTTPAAGPATALGPE